MPRISIVVPVYKVESYIHRCIDSILAQTFTDFDLILVDDGSPDNCGKICDKYAEKDTRIHVIHQENGGLSAARNAGIDWAFKNSDSEWLTFIDSDDWIHIQCLELLYSCAMSNKLNIVSCKYVFTEDFIADKTINLTKVEKSIDSPEQLFLHYNFDIGLACRTIYKKILFARARFPVGKFFEDMQVITPILYSQKTIGFINYVLYYYYVNYESITNSQKSPKWINDLFSSHILQLFFLSKNSFTPSFNSRFRRFKKLFSELIKLYGNNKNYKYVFKTNYKQAKNVFKTHKDLIYLHNPQSKKYGFKKWLTGQADDLDNLKNDIKTVETQRGKLFALMWGIKQRINIYNKYRKLPF